MTESSSKTDYKSSLPNSCDLQLHDLPCMSNSFFFLKKEEISFKILFFLTSQTIHEPSPTAFINHLLLFLSCTTWKGTIYIVVHASCSQPIILYHHWIEKLNYFFLQSIPYLLDAGNVCTNLIFCIINMASDGTSIISVFCLNRKRIFSLNLFTFDVFKFLQGHLFYRMIQSFG